MPLEPKLNNIVLTSLRSTYYACATVSGLHASVGGVYSVHSLLDRVAISTHVLIHSIGIVIPVLLLVWV